MSPTEHLIAFSAMALAILAILVVGTLAAADIIHFGRREPAAKAGREEDPKPAENLAEALAPLGSSLAAGSQLRPGTERAPAPTSHDKELAPSDSGAVSDAHR
jgi:hypothetical protein